MGTSFHTAKWREEKCWQCFQVLTVSSFPCLWWTSNALSRRVQGRRLENSGWGRVDKRTLQTHVCISVRPSRFLRNKATSWHSGCDGIRARAQAQLRNPLEKSQLKGNEGPQGSRPKNNPRVNCNLDFTVTVQYTWSPKGNQSLTIKAFCKAKYNLKTYWLIHILPNVQHISIIFCDCAI